MKSGRQVSINACSLYVESFIPLVYLGSQLRAKIEIEIVGEGKSESNGGLSTFSILSLDCCPLSRRVSP